MVRSDREIGLAGPYCWLYSVDSRRDVLRNYRVPLNPVVHEDNDYYRQLLYLFSLIILDIAYE
jgi:hypothetical protein